VDCRIAIFLYLAGGISLNEGATADHDRVPTLALRESFLKSDCRLAVFERGRLANWGYVNKLKSTAAQASFQQKWKEQIAEVLDVECAEMRDLHPNLVQLCA
jgi:hypothetical protein